MQKRFEYNQKRRNIFSKKNRSFTKLSSILDYEITNQYKFSKLENEFDEYINNTIYNCTICNSYLEQNDKKVLECEHDICQQCYDNIIPNKNNEIRCPFCRNVNEEVVTEEMIQERRQNILDGKVEIFIFVVLAIFIVFMILYLFYIETL